MLRIAIDIEAIVPVPRVVGGELAVWACVVDAQLVVRLVRRGYWVTFLIPGDKTDEWVCYWEQLLREMMLVCVDEEEHNMVSERVELSKSWVECVAFIGCNAVRCVTWSDTLNHFPSLHSDEGEMKCH